MADAGTGNTGKAPCDHDQAAWDTLYATGGGEMFDFNIIANVVKKPVLDRLTGGKRSAHFFLPLCGKSPDMAWLIGQGYSVTGVEWSETAIEQFFTEHKIEHAKETDVSVGGGKAVVYRGTEVPITIYSCDFLAVSGDTIGTFDCIWDSGSICAFSDSQRPAYAAKINSLLKCDGHYLLSVFDYKESAEVTQGHGHHAIPPSVVEQLFGKRFTIELAQKGDKDFMIKMFAMYEHDGSHDDHHHDDHGHHHGDHEHQHGDHEHQEDHHDDAPPVSEWEWNFHLLTPKT